MVVHGFVEVLVLVDILAEEYYHYNETVHYNVITYNEVQEEEKEAVSTLSERICRITFNKYLVVSIAGSLTE